MIARKVQEVNGTYLISLPKSWVLRVGLGKGAVVTLKERQDGSILVSAGPEGPRVHENDATVVCPVKGLSVSDIVTGLYLMGYDRVDIRWRTGNMPASDRESVRGLTRRLAGVEIIDEAKDRISLGCIIDPSSMKPKMILRRMGFLASNMVQDLSVAAKEGQGFEPVISSDDDLDRAYFLLVRLLRSGLRRPQLTESMELAPTDYLDYRLAAELIESIGDKISNSASEARTSPETAKSLRQLSQTLSAIGLTVIGASVEAFISQDREKADEARSAIDALRERLRSDLGGARGRRSADSRALATTVAFACEILESCTNLLDLICPVDAIVQLQ